MKKMNQSQIQQRMKKISKRNYIQFKLISFPISVGIVPVRWLFLISLIIHSLVDGVNAPIKPNNENLQIIEGSQISEFCGNGSGELIHLQISNWWGKGNKFNLAFHWVLNTFENLTAWTRISNCQVRLGLFRLNCWKVTP